MVDARRPMVSLICSAFNEEDFLDEMIESVIAQEMLDWELVICDDGSTDETAAILRRWASADPRVRVPSSGVKLGKVRAFNRSFEESRGDLICLIGGDDTLPVDSFSSRVELLGEYANVAAAGYFKIRTFSELRKFDGAILPKGSSGSRSGGSITLTRPLAEIVFPIPEVLPAEDIWLRHAAAAVSERSFESQQVVLNYRIHERNSNPRHLPFARMNESLHLRQGAILLVLEQDRFPIPRAQRAELELLWQAESFRFRGELARVLMMRGLPLIERLGVAQASNRWLRWLRNRAYLFASGWRRA